MRIEPGVMLANIDHLIYAVPELEQGRDHIERLLGVRPVLGGRHPAYATHNALLSLGRNTYLEVMAHDPGARRPDAGVLFDLDARQESALLTWVLRSEDIEEHAAAAPARVGLGRVESGRRENPDGTLLTWRLTDPRAMPCGGVVPFLIAWGATPHPAERAPRAGELIELRAEHPEPQRVRDALAALGVEMAVDASEHIHLIARIRTAQGDALLR